MLYNFIFEMTGVILRGILNWGSLIHWFAKEAFKVNIPEDHLKRGEACKKSEILCCPKELLKYDFVKSTVRQGNKKSRELLLRSDLDCDCRLKAV